jgi:hypothetical protein
VPTCKEQINSERVADKRGSPNGRSARVKARDDGFRETKAEKEISKKSDEVLMVWLETDESQVTTEVERVTYHLPSHPNYV